MILKMQSALSLHFEVPREAPVLQDIKEKYGRKSPNISKKSYGLNAWLKHLDVECKWIDNENSEWSTLTITGYIPRI